MLGARPKSTVESPGPCSEVTQEKAFCPLVHESGHSPEGRESAPKQEHAQRNLCKSSSTESWAPGLLTQGALSGGGVFNPMLILHTTS